MQLRNEIIVYDSTPYEVITAGDTRLTCIKATKIVTIEPSQLPFKVKCYIVYRVFMAKLLEIVRDWSSYFKR